MIYSSLIFWLLLILPGYAIVRRVSPQELQKTGPGCIALSYLAVFAALSPISIFCYWWQLPIDVFAVAIIGGVAWAVVDLSRGGQWRELGKMIALVLGVELVILLLDSWLGVRIGGYLAGDISGTTAGGDERFHLARIRFLLDHGFSNHDPFVAGDYFFPLYHTNLMHALFATAARLSGGDPLPVWFVALGWAKLVNACGVYFLGWSLFRHKATAWAMTLFFIGAQFDNQLALFPNKLAPGWVMAMMLGLAIQVVRTSRRSAILMLVAGQLVLCQIHGLYAAFATMLITPGLMLCFAASWRDRFSRQKYGLALAGLAIVIPFIWITHTGLTQSTAKDTAFTQYSHSSACVTAANQGRLNPDSTQVSKSTHWAGHHGFMLAAGMKTTSFIRWALMCAAAIYILRTLRQPAWVMVTAAMLASLFLHVPLMSNWLQELTGIDWITQRLYAIEHLCMIALVVGSATDMLVRKWTAPMFPTGCALIALIAGYVFAHPKEFQGRQSFAQTGIRTVRHALADSNIRLHKLNELRTVRSFFASHIAPGAIILADSQTEMWAVMLHDCKAIAIGRGGAVTDINRRRVHLKKMLLPQTRWQQRASLLQRYKAQYYIISPITRPISQWAIQRFSPVNQHEPYVIAELKSNKSR